MTTPVFPTLPGRGWDITRSIEWSTTVQTARSGKETRIGNWTYPVYHWELVYDLLRASASYPEFQQLAAFFDTAGGQLGTFLYTDTDDNTATSQQIGIGDGTTTTFQLVRAFGGYVEPIFAPNAISSMTVGGVSTGSYTVAPFGGTSPGLVTFSTPPAPGAAIVASFTFYFPCRFEADKLDFKSFAQAMYSADKVPFRSVK